MKKKIILICSLLFAVLMVPVILVSFAFGLAPQYDRSFYGGMAIKYKRLHAVEGSKAVIIGGSSVAFGIRSDILEQEIGMPVVNFGLYANLGTKYMLDVAKDAIGEGDIVIIAPEQNAQSLSLYFNGEAVWYSVDGNYNILKKVSTDNYRDLAKGFLKFTSGKFGYWKDGKKPYPSGVYNVDSFDSYGDITYERPYNTMKEGYDIGTPISFAKDVVSVDFIDYLNHYAQSMRARGAKVYYSFCPMNKSALQEGTGDEQISEYYDYLGEKLAVDILGNPVKRLLDSEWFYDSNFHLNDSGSVYYTLQLAQDIKSATGDYTPLKTDVPSKPQKPEENGVSGIVSDDLEAASKIFELSGVHVSVESGKLVYKGEWVIEGLTEYGASLEEIVIPDTLMGLPVTTLASNCFAGNETVRKITFGQAVSTVGQGAFDGCVHLQGIYITSKSPNTFHPSADLLNNLHGCAFYVPQDVYLDYLLDYFWGYFGGDTLKTY